MNTQSACQKFQHHVALSQATDEELVSRTLDGQLMAFDLLICRHHERFLRQARGLVKDEAEAQDIVQTAFLNMYRKLDTFQHGSNYRSWAYRVVMNTGLMHLRKKRYRQEVDIERVHPTSLTDEQPPSWGVAPRWSVRADEELANKELRFKISAAIEELPPKYQSVFRMREIDHLSLKEIGDALELSVPAVKSRLHRARLFLRATLEPYVMG